ncbi:hypothetical protein PV08_08984 [Exophiala spinifera]|uniref:Amine oxidase n=1 Tax=Exophiala spinifera TaxID=91928 RepID=A0A0D1ZLS5_9EURO|nr:uncharacterized protein PV08_08984 [Exophiala spinifera]KIW13792.1 hypothetical protein PV08_08984 [Exophiala spinifera]
MPRAREGYLWTKTGLTQGLTTNAVVSSTKSIRSHYDVIIIGAGFAGLIAARELSRQHRLSVLIVEGRDRVGGRTWTANAHREEFEMGGTWVHWNQPHLYAELYRYNLHKNLKTSAGTLAAEKTYYRGAGGREAQVEEVDGQDFGQIAQAVADRFFVLDGLNSRELMPYPHDPFRDPAPWKKYDHLTIRQRLDQLDLPTVHKDYFETLCNSFGSATGTEIGFVEALRWYALGGHSMDRVFELAGIYKLGNGGMTSFALKILQDTRCDILLDTVISEIIQQSPCGSTIVKSQNTQTVLNGKAVISTVPLNCLGDISFTPPLGGPKREAISKGHINKGAKIHFKLKATEPGWFAAANGYGDSSFCFSFSDHNGHGPSGPDGTYCIGFGYNGFVPDPRDSTTIIDEFKRNLRPDAEVEAYLTHDWANDPLAKGVWSSWGSGCMTKYTKVLQEPHGQVFFASGDWADGWRGFIDGAIESGRKAANEVAALFDTSAQAKL